MTVPVRVPAAMPVADSTCLLPDGDDTLAADAHDTLDALSHELLAPGALRDAGPGLAGGASGVALFHRALDARFPGRGHAAAARRLLRRAARSVMAAPLPPSFSAGLTGIAWAWRLAADEPDGGLADAVLARTAELADRGAPIGFDLVDGWAGCALLALESPEDPIARDALARILVRLEREAIADAGGLAWPTRLACLPPEAHVGHTDGELDAGLAHGAPGVLVVAARAAAIGVEPERAARIAGGAARWLLAHRFPAHARQVFPSCVIPGRGPTGASHPGWCYGDLGVAAALLVAARALDEPTWERAALSAARRVARLDAARLPIADAGLCHGAAGVAHLLARIAGATGDVQIAGASRAWFARTLALRGPTGRGRRAGRGFRALRGGTAERPTLRRVAGLLTGSAGIGLALDGALGGSVAWDRALGISA